MIYGIFLNYGVLGSIWGKAREERSFCRKQQVPAVRIL